MPIRVARGYFVAPIIARTNLLASNEVASTRKIVEDGDAVTIHKFNMIQGPMLFHDIYYMVNYDFGLTNDGFVVPTSFNANINENIIVNSVISMFLNKRNVVRSNS